FLNLHPLVPAKVIRFPIVLRDQVFSRTLQTSVAISPDGQSIVYRANADLFLRQLADSESRPMGTSDSISPIFSPDGQWVAFWTSRDRTIKKIAVTGGTAITLGEARDTPSSLSWEGDYIVYTQANVVMALPGTGGKAEPWIKLNSDEAPDSPQLLPG